MRSEPIAGKGPRARDTRARLDNAHLVKEASLSTPRGVAWADIYTPDLRPVGIIRKAFSVGKQRASSWGSSPRYDSTQGRRHGRDRTQLLLLEKKVADGAKTARGRSAGSAAASFLECFEIATLGIGYADGYRRILGNHAVALVGGRRAPVVGVVTMDMTMLDVTDVPPATFTLAGYAPVSMQMVLLRYWTSHGRPASIALAPQGTARIEPRGRDTITFSGQTRTLERYSVSGVLWGRETLWADERGNLQALVSVDAEFDHFEAVRPELEPAVPQLIARAASDGMAAMAETAAAINPPPAHVLAITGATLVDVTGKRPPHSRSGPS